MNIETRTEENTIACSVNANFMLKGWLELYGILMRQALNGEDRKQEVIKACKRVLEDLESPPNNLDKIKDAK